MRYVFVFTLIKDFPYQPEQHPPYQSLMLESAAFLQIMSLVMH